MKITAERVSIIEADTEAIVNAANRSLLGGGGVDGVIHRAAGPGLLEECRELGGCAVGEVKATSAHDLPYSHILHAVGPIWRGGSEEEDERLAACYRNAVMLADTLGIESLTFPAISTGAYAFPSDRAARISVGSLMSLRDKAALKRVVLAAIDASTVRLLERSLKEANYVQ